MYEYINPDSASAILCFQPYFMTKIENANFATTAARNSHDIKIQEKCPDATSFNLFLPT